MGKATHGRGARDELAVVGELLAALVEALTGGTPEEIVAVARLLEERATVLAPTTADPERVAALVTLRERAALLVQTLFTTTDQFLVDARSVQARGQGYRPGRGGAARFAAESRLDSEGTLATLARYRQGLSDLRI
ncbi:hypothetical protein NET03_07240 [Thermomicrobium sp. CFH 73360]|uniref:hypothetical protein n=1 Tax=Thermomicrobium sp. CFH 73360 TaxID=2951987 RepID=UPI002077490A|nr:hypothetical protein [Thermomicrobium sp. CFH 73360]MCM8746324.1 hypothetical protein [Thermomicrobium sp. CFH 73360]